MGQISSGVGLISGLPINDIIDQLVAIESRPRDQAHKQVAVLNSQQIAFQDINAKLLSLKLGVSGFATNRTFNQTTITSSDSALLGASTSSSVNPGSYSFIVDRLVAAQQMITVGFSDPDATALGAGTLTFEFGDGRLDSKTVLSQLNGGGGVPRGEIRITDRSGSSVHVDLSRSLTVDDVLTAINTTVGISVTARIKDDGFVIQDNTGSTTAVLNVTDVDASGITTALGLDVASVGNVLEGNQANFISMETPLSLLDDGQGVEINGAFNAHLRIQYQNMGLEHVDIDLTGATTIGDVISAINTQTDHAVTAAINENQTGVSLAGKASQVGVFEVQALNGTSADDLGILGVESDADGVINGSRILSTINSKLIRKLNGGSGVDLGTIGITNRLGATTNVDLSTAGSVAQLVDLINAAAAGVTASLNQAGNGLRITDKTGATASNLMIFDVNGAAAAGLNMTGSHGSAIADSGNLQYEYISNRTLLSSFNGGRGVSRGKFTIMDSSGATSEVDLTQGNEISVKDVIAEMNSKGLLINARVNDKGDGILIEDRGPGTVIVNVKESGSSTAEDLGLLGSAVGLGSDLDGSFEKTVSVSQNDTLNDVTEAINRAGINVSAAVINDGSPTSPFRMSFTADHSGLAGAFIFDEGTLDLRSANLSEARDAVVFFGSGDPVDGVAIRSSSNSLTSVIPGVDIDLKGTSDKAVQLTISRDDSAVVGAVQGFVDDFNGIIDTLDSLDSYDVETQERGLLLGDPTVATVRNSMYRMINKTFTDLTGQFTNITQLGVTIGTGAKLKFDSTRFVEALNADRDGVEALLTFKETQTDSDTNETILAAGGFGARFNDLLGTLTDSVNGTVQLRLHTLQDQVDLGNSRIVKLGEQLDAKRARLEVEFMALERALSQIQSQGSALVTLQQLAQANATFGL